VQATGSSPRCSTSMICVTRVEIAVPSGVMAPSHRLSLSSPAILPGHAGMKKQHG
jgi:hypothetical protein